MNTTMISIRMEVTMKVLVAEDKQDIANLVKIYLQKEGYDVICTNNGNEAYSIVEKGNINLCIFDVMMPGLDGFTLVHKIRKFSSIPIILLTAKSTEQDKILGLDLGADDYITKPFSSLELVSRVNAQIRRNYTFNTKGTLLNYGSLSIDTEKCQVHKNGMDCSLTAMEYKILLKFINNPERVYTKNQLYKDICGTYTEGDEGTIAVHISRLREKIEDTPKEPRYIKTIRGLGYKIDKV